MQPTGTGEPPPPDVATAKKHRETGGPKRPPKLPRQRPQDSVGENSYTTRYAPSDEKTDKVDPKRTRTKAGVIKDATRLRQGEGPQPPPPKKPPPEPQAPQSASYPTGELATSYGQTWRERYTPAKPFQADVSLNMDTIRDHKDIFFADPHLLEASVLLFQDHRLSETESLGFIQNASQE